MEITYCVPAKNTLRTVGCLKMEDKQEQIDENACLISVTAEHSPK
jgi:hypothetical protein